tara:strand:+ start:573 stop:1397 length:825 start_codon:yes stop_codon:yes gene_type:complete
MTQALVDEQWTQRLLFEAHATMQSILGKGPSSTLDNTLAKEVRDTFREVQPLCELVDCKDYWYTGAIPPDEILRGITPRSERLVRVRHTVEVPASEATAALIQPQVGLTCLIPNARVDTIEGDDFDTTFGLRVPSQFHSRFDTLYRVRRRILGHSSTESTVLVLWEDAPGGADAEASHFGRHLLVFEASEVEEVRITCVLDTAAVPFYVPRWGGMIAYQVLYFRLGAACNLFRKRATEYYMRGPDMQAALAESKRARLLCTWLDARLCDAVFDD